MRAGIRSRPWAGLDVGSYSIKLLALQPGVAGVRHWVSEVALPQPLRDANGPPSDDAIAKAIAECMALAGFSPRSFRGLTLGLSGSDLVVKQISLPLLDDNEVGPALRFEARKHLPFDLQSMVIDFQILARYPSEKKLDVLLAAVSQQRVDRALAPLRLLGLDVDILDAAPLALTNALSRGIEQDSEARVLLDIGFASSYLTLFQRGEPYFSRRLDFGGATLTRAIAEASRVPYAEAEEWKLAAGADDPTVRVNWESPEMQAMRDSLRHDLVEDLRRSFAFYRTLGRLPDPLTLWLSGGSARLPGLAAQISEMLEIPTLMFNPLDTLGADQRTVAPPGGPQFALAYGLALRTA